MSADPDGRNDYSYYSDRCNAEQNVIGHTHGQSEELLRDFIAEEGQERRKVRERAKFSVSTVAEWFVVILSTRVSLPSTLWLGSKM